jgi:hypothetical protein
MFSLVGDPDLVRNAQDHNGNRGVAAGLLGLFFGPQSDPIFELGLKAQNSPGQCILRSWRKAQHGLKTVKKTNKGRTLLAVHHLVRVFSNRGRQTIELENVSDYYREAGERETVIDMSLE